MVTPGPRCHAHCIVLANLVAPRACPLAAPAHLVGRPRHVDAPRTSVAGRPAAAKQRRTAPTHSVDVRMCVRRTHTRACPCRRCSSSSCMYSPAVFHTAGQVQLACFLHVCESILVVLLHTTVRTANILPWSTLT
jgi:hypothetical protein